MVSMATEQYKELGLGKTTGKHEGALWFKSEEDVNEEGEGKMAAALTWKGVVNPIAIAKVVRSGRRIFGIRDRYRGGRHTGLQCEL